MDHTEAIRTTEGVLTRLLDRLGIGAGHEIEALLLMVCIGQFVLLCLLLARRRNGK